MKPLVKKLGRTYQIYSTDKGWKTWSFLTIINIQTPSPQRNIQIPQADYSTTTHVLYINVPKFDKNILKITKF